MKEKILSIILMVILLIGIVGITNVNAASYSVSTGVSSTDVEVGKTITVTVSFSPAVGQAEINLNYNNSIVRYISASIPATDRGTSVTARQLAFDAVSLSQITFTFETIAEGTANFSLGSVKLGDLQSQKIEPSDVSVGGGRTVTVKNKVVDPNPPVVNPDPGTTNPGTTNPGTTNPGTTNPGTTNPGTTNPGTTNPTTPNDEPTFRNDNSTVYATSNVNIRSSWTTAENNILGMLKKGEEITRTGISSGWDRVTYNGKTAYIRHGYLTTEKPDENEEDEIPVDDNQVGIVDPIENETNTTENNAVGGDDTVTNKPATASTKKNGKTLAIVCSIIAIVVAGIIIFIIYKKTNDEEDEEENNSKSNTRNSAIKNTTARTSTTRSTTTRTTGTKNATTRNNSKTTTGKKE